VTIPRIPSNFTNGGQLLAQAPGSPALEWICGPVAPAGADGFRIALDRTWPDSPAYLAARHQGTTEIRDAVTPGGVRLLPNTNGQPQHIIFEAIPDVTAGTKSITLSAKSSGELPVRFFVRAGPARVVDSELVFTPIPPRAKMPIEVTVTAWQWGRSTAPAVQTAAPVERRFYITSKS
jgi:hypothetical protein